MNHPMLPEGTIPCVWMKAGVLTYKLCDRGLDCDRCPLHAAITFDPTHVRSGQRGPVPGGWIFPDDRAYHFPHYWARAEGPEEYVLGLDLFAARLLSSVHRLELAPPGSQVARDGVIGVAEMDQGSVPIRAPAGGRIVRSNAGLSAAPQRFVDDPYRDGWLVAMRPESPAAWRKGEVGAKEIEGRAAADLRRLRRRIAAALLAAENTAVPFLQDGGELVHNWSAVLGGERYLAIVKALISGV